MNKKEREISYCGWAPSDEGEENFIVVEYEDGGSVDCEVLGVFENEGKEYIALVYDKDISEEIYLYEYNQVNEKEIKLTDITSHKQFHKIVETFERISAEEVSRLHDYFEGEREEEDFDTAVHEFNAEKKDSDDIPLIHE